MRRRSFLTMSGAAGMAAAIPGIRAASAATTGTAATATRTAGLPGNAASTLRGLAAPIGLRIGTAVIPFDLDTPAYKPCSPSSSR